MTTLDITGPAALGPVPRKRIGGRQLVANALPLAWRSLAQLQHSPEKLLAVNLSFRFHTGVLPALAALGLAYVFYLAVCWISVLIGLIAPGPETVQGIAFIFIMPLVFGSSILVPNTRTFPGWLQAWVKVNPITHLADAVRGLTVGGPASAHVLYTLAWAAGIVLVTFPLALRMYSRRV